MGPRAVPTAERKERYRNQQHNEHGELAGAKVIFVTMCMLVLQLLWLRRESASSSSANRLYLLMAIYHVLVELEAEKELARFPKKRSH
jgi:hypothetical protein